MARIKFLLLAGVLLAVASPSFATIVCGSATTISAASAAGGCIVGANIFSNFSIATSTESGGTPTGAIDPTQVSIQISQAGNTFNLVLSNATPTNWQLSGTQQFNLILTYTVTGGAWWLAVGDSLVGSATTNVNGTGAVAYDKSADGVTLPTLSVSGITTNAPVGFAGAPLSTFNVTDNIQVHATNATATLVSGTNSFVVPEPMTFSLMGAGLLGLGLLGRRLRK
jgi:hypothetical protein